jgi:predicted ATP-binding protein involved in virulence
MKITKLELKNFRCFEQYELNLLDRFNLLIGDNGSGKTAVLDALAISAGSFLLGIIDILSKDKRHITKNDIRYEQLEMGQTVIKEVEEVTIIYSEGLIENKHIDWTRYKDIRTSGKYAKDIIDIAKNLYKKKTDRNTFLPIIAYYSTGRLWKQLKITDKKTKSPTSRFEGYQDCLNPASDQKRFFNWFKTQELIALQEKVEIHILEAVRNAIINMIPDAKNVFWSIKLDELVIETEIQGKMQSLPFRLLSDGYRNMIGMVADIAYRMATLNPQLETEVIKQTEGIILIDEIDLHLHPKWQRIVIERLLNTFPKVQFVATTHSPFIIQSLYHKKDCLLWDLEQHQPLEITSKSFEDIAEDLQGVEIPQQSRRFLDMEKAAEEYYRVLKQLPLASEEEKQKLKQKLDELLMPYSDDPSYQAFLKMERLAVDGE